MAEIWYSAERYLEAANYYGEADSEDSGTMIKRAHSFFLGGEVQKALNLLNSVPEKTSLSFQELLLDCLKVVQPHSERIPPLDRHVPRVPDRDQD